MSECGNTKVIQNKNASGQTHLSRIQICFLTTGVFLLGVYVSTFAPRIFTEYSEKRFTQPQVAAMAVMDPKSEDPNECASEKAEIVSQKDKIIQNLNHLLEMRNVSLHKKTKALSQKDKMIEDLTRLLEDMNASLLNETAIVSQKDKTIHNLTTQLESTRNSSLHKKADEVSEKEYIIQNLTDELKKKLDAITHVRLHTGPYQSCHERKTPNYDDDCSFTNRTCLRTTIPEDPRERIENIINSHNSYVPNRYLDVLESMRQNVDGGRDKQLIIASALSSNHYKESQAMIRDFHENLFPTLTNFTFVLYDLGLTDEEREQVKKHCRCTFVKFPFEKLPESLLPLKCFSWKVFIIAAHNEQADVVLWADASIRILSAKGIQTLIKRTKIRGIQQRNFYGMRSIPQHTIPEVFHEFGDSPCIFTHFRMCEGNFGLYHREPLIRRAVILPWLACASRPDCMCQSNWNDLQKCWKPDRKPKQIGDCNRYDQSVVSIILAKLFREKYYHFAVDTRNAQHTNRGHSYNYFAEIERNATVTKSNATVTKSN